MTERVSVMNEVAEAIASNIHAAWHPDHPPCLGDRSIECEIRGQAIGAAVIAVGTLRTLPHALIEDLMAGCD